MKVKFFFGFFFGGGGDDLVLFWASCSENRFSYTGQENPTGSLVLDFSVWYCLSGTALPVR